MLRATVLAVAAVALGCGERERWSEQDWAQTLSRAEARLPPAPAAMQAPSCSATPTTGTCFLDAEERRVRYALLLDANRVRWEWAQQLCEQIAFRTKRAEWAKLAEQCAGIRRGYLSGLRGDGVLDDAALVEASDRDGHAEYVHFLKALSSRLGPRLEDPWHEELRIIASRRDASAPRLTFPLPRPGCAAGDSLPDCMLLPEARVHHRTEILQNFLNTWTAQLWSACEVRAAAASHADLPALATTCLDLRDLVVMLAMSGIRKKDAELIGCKNLSREEREWPALINDKLAGRPAQEVALKPGPCEGQSIEGHL